MLISVKLLAKYFKMIYALASTHEKFGLLNQSRFKVEIPSWAKRIERLSSSKLKWAFLTDSNAELFKYLINAVC